MFIDYRLQIRFLPLRGVVLTSIDALFPPASITPETVRLYTISWVRNLGTVHLSVASRPRTGDGFMLKGLDKRVGSRHRFSQSASQSRSHYKPRIPCNPV